MLTVSQSEFSALPTALCPGGGGAYPADTYPHVFVAFAVCDLAGGSGVVPTVGLAVVLGCCARCGMPLLGLGPLGAGADAPAVLLSVPTARLAGW
jgi:hypothetical protein